MDLFWTGVSQVSARARSSGIVCFDTLWLLFFCPNFRILDNVFSLEKLCLHPLVCCCTPSITPLYSISTLSVGLTCLEYPRKGPTNSFKVLIEALSFVFSFLWFTVFWCFSLLVCTLRQLLWKCQNLLPEL